MTAEGGPGSAKVVRTFRSAYGPLNLPESRGVVIEPGLEGGHPLAGLFEILDRALELDFESSDPLFQFHRLRHVELVRARSGGRSAVATQAVQRGMSVRKVCVLVTRNNSRANGGYAIACSRQR